jgi:hypothetical protein
MDTHSGYKGVFSVMRIYMLPKHGSISDVDQLAENK